MKWVTFAFAFILTAFLIIAGIIIYPEILGKAAIFSNDYVFALFLGPFFVVLFFSWIVEKLVLKIFRKE
jgi:hypothetical protein